MARGRLGDRPKAQPVGPARREYRPPAHHPDPVLDQTALRRSVPRHDGRELPPRARHLSLHETDGVWPAALGASWLPQRRPSGCEPTTAQDTCQRGQAPARDTRRPVRTVPSDHCMAPDTRRAECLWPSRFAAATPLHPVDARAQSLASAYRRNRRSHSGSESCCRASAVADERTDPQSETVDLPRSAQRAKTRATGRPEPASGLPNEADAVLA